MGRLSTLSVAAPAKINLFLAITGRRTDGFHDLLSVAAQLTWGDMLEVDEAAEGFTVSCDNPGVPVDESNLVLRAARAFALATGWTGGARFVIRKKIPLGAGLGGASSDATAALQALNTLAGGPLDAPAMAAVASSVGSDCALFLSRVPVVMRGRGERVEPLGREPYSRIRGVRVLVFKPAFSIPTPWAYSRLVAEAPRGYVRPNAAESRLLDWTGRAGAPTGELLFNSMERAAFPKYPALPTMIELLRGRFGIPARMSGSGSACFALLHEAMEVAQIESAIRDAWGPSAFVVESRIA
jgi:4-diphosphocytidyl-2-C-methyl-D-erythritol kinase